MSKRLDGIIACKDKTSSWRLIGLPDGSNIVSKYNVGEKPNLILYRYFRHVHFIPIVRVGKKGAY